MNYLDEVKVAVEQHCGCQAEHERTERNVTETYFGKQVWKGNVEVFKLVGHPQAQRAYAWGYPVERGPREINTVLEVPPVTSPLTAVRAVIAAHARQSSARSTRPSKCQ